MTRMARAHFQLPQESMVELDAYCRRLGITRSALVRYVMLSWMSIDDEEKLGGVLFGKEKKTSPREKEKTPATSTEEATTKEVE